jgi:hypothetical protein
MEFDDADERAAKVQQLSSQILQCTTTEAFTSNCQNVWDHWITLLSQTILPWGIPSRDLRVTLAFRAIEHTISQAKGSLQWLAYLQLIRVFDTLKDSIRRERQSRLCTRKRGTSDDTIIIDIFQEALEGSLKRSTILQQRRISKRWLLLSKSPCFLFLFSDQAEVIV